jgi:undecaprenyl-diphosphatase
MLHQLNALDTRLFLWINSFHSSFWDKVMWHVSGRFEWLPLYLLLIGFLIYTKRKKSILIIAGSIIAVVLADQLAVHAFKDVIGRLRPSQNPAIRDFVHIVNNYRGGLYGFVSNHAANTFALATFLCLAVRNQSVSISLFLWAALLSYSRIYLGVHYPGDVFAGAIFGAIIGWIVYLIYKRLSGENKPSLLKYIHDDKSKRL